MEKIVKRKSVELGLAWFFKQADLKNSVEPSQFAIQCSDESCTGRMYPINHQYPGDIPEARFIKKGTIQFKRNTHKSEECHVDFECQACGQVDRISIENYN